MITGIRIRLVTTCSNYDHKIDFVVEIWWYIIVYSEYHNYILYVIIIRIDK